MLGPFLGPSWKLSGSDLLRVNRTQPCALLGDIAGLWTTSGSRAPSWVGGRVSHGTLAREGALSSAAVAWTLQMIFEQGALHFWFALGSTNYVAGLEWEAVTFRRGPHFLKHCSTEREAHLWCQAHELTKVPGGQASA